MPCDCAHAMCSRTTSGRQEAGGDRVTGTRHHRERQRGQHCLQQSEIIFLEPSRPIGREGIGNPGAVRKVALRAEAEDLREIIRTAFRGELLEHREVELLSR